LIGDLAHAPSELIAGTGFRARVLELATRVGGNFGADIKVTGLHSFQDVGGKVQAAVVVPATEQTAKDAIGRRHSGIELPLAEGGGGIELEGQLTITLRRLLIKLLIVTEVGPGLGALGGAQDAGDVQVGRSQMPGLIRIEVKPELIELGKQAIVEQGDAPPAGGVGGDRLAVGPAEGV